MSLEEKKSFNDTLYTAALTSLNVSFMNFTLLIASNKVTEWMCGSVITDKFIG